MRNRKYTNNEPIERGPARLRVWLLFGLLACLVTYGRAAADPVRVVFVYGSEKDKWLQAVTKTYNDQQNRTDDGSVIDVVLQPMGSGELVDELKNGDLKPTLASPASEVFLKLAEPGIVGETVSLVKSPVVIAMWEDKANAIGWPGKAIGWKDVFDMADRKAGWGEFNHPEWGRFKFGHTHPEHSNSGLIAVVAQVYAATGKTKGLTVEDVGLPATGGLLGGIGRSVVYYGSSTGFFAARMTDNPDLLDAAVLYENLVIDHNKPGAKRLVAIYPSEGTFMSDHPAGIVQRPWVSDVQKQAAAKYLAFLLADEQQKQAMKFGFRPGKASIAVGAPVDAAHGADPAQPASLLEVPSNEVIKACKEAWRQAKKPANVILVLGCRSAEYRATIQDHAERLIAQLGPKDKLSVLLSNNKPHFAAMEQLIRTPDERDAIFDRLGEEIRAMKEADDQQLVDAIEKAHRVLNTGSDTSEYVCTVIVLSDGANDDIEPIDLQSRIKFDRATFPVTTVPVAYGKPPDPAQPTAPVPPGIAAMTDIAKYSGYGSKPMFAPVAPTDKSGPAEKVYEGKTESLIRDLSAFLSGHANATATAPK